MADYIDRKKLLRKKRYCFQTEGMPFPRSDWFLKLQDILQLKTEDVVKVVRCKDCKFYHRSKPYHCDKVSYFESGINDIFYCALGAKK